MSSAGHMWSSVCSLLCTHALSRQDNRERQDRSPARGSLDWCELTDTYH